MVKIPDVPKDTPAHDVTRAAVVGAGTMGGGITMTYANAGIPVLLKDVDEAALERGLATMRKNYEASVAKGRITREAFERTWALITPTISYDAFDTADIVVEAVFENMDLKRSTFADLGRVTGPDCILASNSSTLDIDEFARASGRPAQVLGHHFFSPANVMKLLEIVRGRETSKETIHVAQAGEAIEPGRRGRRQLLPGSSPTGCSPTTCARCALLQEGASDAPDRQRAHRLRHAGRPVRHAGHRGHRRLRGFVEVLKSIGETRAEGPQSEVPDPALRGWDATGRRPARAGYHEPGSGRGSQDPLVDRLAEGSRRAAALCGSRSRTPRSSRAS